MKADLLKMLKTEMNLHRRVLKSEFEFNLEQIRRIDRGNLGELSVSWMLHMLTKFGWKFKFDVLSGYATRDPAQKYELTQNGVKLAYTEHFVDVLNSYPEKFRIPGRPKDMSLDQLLIVLERLGWKVTIHEQ